MADSTPKVVRNQLYLPHQQQPLCVVGSPAWFDWLQTAAAFRYHSDRRRNIIHGYGPLLAPISVRKEQRRQGFLWYAYRRAFGTLHKRYVGKATALTADRLEEVALMLNETP